MAVSRLLGLRASLAGVLTALLLTARCATPPKAIPESEGFPLDPREGLPGASSAGIERGWQALRAGDTAGALSEFEAASGESEAAARIGRIEAQVIGGEFEPALAGCRAALEKGEATVPLLVACGEARGRSADAAGGYELYRQALARGEGRPKVVARAAELKRTATDGLLSSARARASEKEWEAARELVGRAIELEPESAAPRREAGEIEAAAGEKEKALARFRQALDLDPGDAAIRARIAGLALDLKDYALAVSVFERLADEDPKFRSRAEEARLAFRVSNWPAPERQAASSARLTRSAAAQLVWWMFPEVREATVTSGVIASDVLGRRDSRALARALALGLLDADRGTHRARPDAPLTEGAAARLLLRLVDLVAARGAVSCLPNGSAKVRTAAEAVRLARDCGLWRETGGTVNGAAFTRALDRVRTVASGDVPPAEPEEPGTAGEREPPRPRGRAR